MILYHYGPQQWSWDSELCVSSHHTQSHRAAIFNLLHLMAHINELLKSCGTPQNIFFADLTKQIGIILIHSHRTAIVVLAVVIFVFDDLREKRHCPWLNIQVLHVLKILAAHWLKIAGVQPTQPSILRSLWGLVHKPQGSGTIWFL